MPWFRPNPIGLVLLGVLLGAQPLCRRTLLACGGPATHAYTSYGKPFVLVHTTRITAKPIRIETSWRNIAALLSVGWLAGMPVGRAVMIGADRINGRSSRGRPGFEVILRPQPAAAPGAA
jgi:hypothetical protein